VGGGRLAREALIGLLNLPPAGCPIHSRLLRMSGRGLLLRENLGFVSGYRFSDAATSSESQFVILP
jgi:hypothetical protein